MYVITVKVTWLMKFAINLTIVSNVVALTCHFSI